MIRHRSGPTTDQKGASKPDAQTRSRGSGSAGKAKEEDQKSSPPTPAVDLEGAHQRAS
jgi:hypothetical protein